MLTSFKISFSRNWFMYGSLLLLCGLFMHIDLDAQIKLSREQERQLENARRPRTTILPGTLPAITRQCPTVQGSDPAIIDVSIRKLANTRTPRRPGSGFINPEFTVTVMNIGSESFNNPEGQMTVQTYRERIFIDQTLFTSLTSCQTLTFTIRPGRLNAGEYGTNFDFVIYDPAVHIVGYPPPYDVNPGNNRMSFFTGDK